MPTAAINPGYRPVGDDEAIPAFLNRALKASAQIGRGQFGTLSLSTGYAELNDGATPNQACVGVGDVANLSDTSSVAGQARARFSQRHFKGVKASTISLDGFADTDFGIPFWIKDENTPGKLTNSGGSNRSLGGVAFGLDTDGNPILWTGPVAWLVGRSAHLLDRVVGGWHQIADAAANTVTAERPMTREPVHGLITAITFDGLAVAADNTDYVTATISKRDGAGGGAVVVGTYDSRAANQGAVTAFVPMAFSLSAVAGALNLLETDVLTVAVAKAGAGKALTGTIKVIQKVI